MNKWISQSIATAISGITITTALTVGINIPRAIALPSATVNQVTKKSAVRIEGASNGSGVIFAEDDYGYIVLTNYHVVEASGDYQIVTADGQAHNAAEIVKLEGADLALVYFDTEQKYPVVAKGNSDSLIEGQEVYIAGYPGSQQVASNRTYRFLSESLSGFLASEDVVGGYELIVTGEAIPGMSGSPIVDNEAQLIGIYGEGDTDLQTGARYVFAIPLNTALKIASRAGMELNPGTSTANQPEANPKIDLFAPAPGTSTAPNTAIDNGNSNNAGFEVVGSAAVNNFVIPEIIYTGECPGRRLSSQEAMFFSNTTTTAPDRRVIVTNITRGLKRDPLPFTDREYQQNQVSEETKITLGSEHEKRYFVVLAGENQFQYEIVQQEPEDLETVLESGTFSATATKEQRTVERNKEPVEETYCPNNAKKCEKEQERVRTVEKCPGETTSSGSSSDSSSDSLFDLFR